MSVIHEDGLGGSITILEAGDETAPMRFRMVLPKGMSPPAPECHREQREDFRVLRGTLDLGTVGGRRVVLRAGDVYELPCGAYHLPANGGEGELEFEATLTPGLDAAEMFAGLYRAMREHQALARVAHTATVFRRHTRAINFKLPVRVALAVVAAVARLLGQRAPAHPAARAQVASP